jgi:hypothetical protein
MAETMVDRWALQPVANLVEKRAASSEVLMGDSTAVMKADSMGDYWAV